MKTKTIFRSLVVIVCFFVYNFSVNAQTWPPSGMNGIGASNNPWQISDSSHLRILADYVNAGNGDSTNGEYYKIMNDIDLNGYSNWKPIGDGRSNDSITCFQGNFDGNGKMVQSLKVNRPTEDYIGLFGRTYNAVIGNLGIENCNIVGQTYVGSLVGYNNNYSTITHCFASGMVSGDTHIGGLVGFNTHNSPIFNCYATNSVVGTNYNIGGLVGNNYLNSPISNCYATGNISGGSQVGGLVGLSEDNSPVSNCYATGNVNGSTNFVGGLVGYNTSIVRNCIAVNDTVRISSSQTSVNRIVGNNGGICNNNYALNSMIVRNSSGNRVSTDGLNTASGMGKTIDVFQNSFFYSTVSNWNNNEVWEMSYSTADWKICDGNSLPFLRWQEITCGGHFSIVATAGNNGNISPLGMVSVTEDSNQTFTFFANVGYIVESLLIDDVNISDSIVVESFTFNGVTGNHTIEAVFSAGYYITATTDSNGSVNPSGKIGVLYGKNQTVAITPNNGYEIDSLWIDGIYTPDSILNRNYTFLNVTENHSIHVTFRVPVFCGGNGTKDNPYLICTPEQLKYLVADYVNAGNGNLTNGKYYKLMNNIDLYRDTNWTPIGNNNTNSNRTRFQGNFNGNGKIIQNLKSNHPTEDYIGLFGIVYQAKIENLGIESCNVAGYNFVGGLTGYNSKSIISNCHITGSISGNGNNIGGLTGSGDNIFNCYVSGNVSGSIDNVGGLTGSGSNIYNCYVSGKVSGGGNSIGGLVGNGNNIFSSHASADVNGKNNVGGLVGYVGGDTIYNCYATGKVNGKTDVFDYYVGGLVGYNYNSIISNCYATGKVEGRNYLGGLVGMNYNAIIRNCIAANDSIISPVHTNYINRIMGHNEGHSVYNNNYALGDMLICRSWLSPSVVDDSIEAGIGKALDTLQNFAFYINTDNWYNNSVWDINPPSGIWKMCDDNHLPFLRWQQISCGDTFNITVIAGNNGTINPSGMVSIAEDNNQTFTFAANANYGVDSLLIDGINISDSIAGGSYTFHSVTKNHTIEVIFTDTFTITAIATGNGRVSPTSIVSVDYNTNQTFTFAPDSGYIVFSLLIDGVNVPDSIAGGSYTFENVIREHSIEVVFVANAIVAMAGSNGSINPSGIISVIDSTNQTFIFIADSGYVIDSLWIDGIYIPDSIINKSYTFVNVTENHIINITFAPDFCGGDGSKENPYQICTHQQLKALADYVNAGNGNSTSGVYYKLMNNIDLNGYSDGLGWKPIGNYASSFRGNFDGNDNTIQNLIINRPTEYYIGLFGRAYSANIRNLNIENCNIVGQERVGSLVGWNNSTVSNCHASGYINGNSYIGGLIGENDYSTISNCYFTGIVIGQNGTGGLLGHCSGSTISNCHVTGSVNGNTWVGGLSGGSGLYSIIDSCYAIITVNGNRQVGGLVGAIQDGTHISNCYTTGNIIGNSDLIGGLLGHNCCSSSVFNCYSTCNVTGNDEVGGLVGNNTSSISNCYASGKINGNGNYVSGLAGNNGGSLRNCIAVNDTVISNTSTSNINRIAGNNSGGTYQNNYSHSAMVIQNNNGNVAITEGLNTTAGMGKNMDTLKNLAFYITDSNWYNNEAWDIDSATAIWKICNDNSLPFLRWQGISCGDTLAITATAGNNGTINPLGIVNIRDNNNQTFTFLADTGYIVDSLLIDGVNVPDSITGGSYTFKNIDRNHTIEVIFSDGYHITATAGNNGSINPSGMVGVNCNTNQFFTFSPNSGYDIDSLWIDGIYIPDSIFRERYTFRNVAELHSIHVTFKKYIDFSGGNGSIEHPYLIYSHRQLKALADFINAGNGNATSGVYYKLMRNIDLRGYTSWDPIGDYSNIYGTTRRFQGNFDGNEKIVQNVTINRSYGDNVALFGVANNATIKNLGVENCNIIGRFYVGGLVGYNSGTTIFNCYTTGSISGENHDIGGLVGLNSNNSHITNCYTTCSVNGNNENNSYIGGLVGRNASSSSISNCYATGNVRGRFSVGGLVGENSNSTIRNCIAANDSIISTTTSINRIAGSNSSNSFFYNNYAFNLMEVKNSNGNVVITDGLNTSVGMGVIMDSLQSLAFYTTAGNWNNNTAWDINPSFGVWKICDGNGLPFLRWQRISCGDIFFITSTAGNNGNINPLGAVGIVDESNQTYTFEANVGYMVDSLLIDDGNISDSIAGGSYTFKNIVENHTIKATFIDAPTQIITASAGDNGSINASGSVSVLYNDNQTLTFSANNCFEIDSLWIDGVYAPDSITVGRYTFRNVKKNHTIHLNFKLKNYFTAISNSICSNMPYHFGGQDLALLGVYYDTLQAIFGCDSVIELTLMVNPIYFTQISASICGEDSYNFHGNLLTAVGIYYDTLQTIHGCDSVVELTLTDSPIYFTQISASICKGNFYNFFGNLLTVNGIYYDTLQTIHNCDSIFELTLTVNPTYIIPETATICQGKNYLFRGKTYTAGGIYRDTLHTINGCDSLFELNLTVNPTYFTQIFDSICQGNSYDFFGQILTTTGVYYDTLQTILGCDSIIELTLTINSLPDIPIISKNDNILTSSVAHSYQWHFNNTLIAGATEQSYICTQEGNYFVKVTNEYGCSSQSEEIKITNVSIVQRTKTNKIKIYPNPTKGELIIENEQLVIENIEIFDTFGKNVGTYLENTENETIIDISHLSTGIYFLRIQTNESVIVQKIIKQK